MANTFTLIASSTVGSGGASSIDFTSIPSTYTDLVVKYSLRNSLAAAQDNVALTFNGTTTGYTEKLLYGDGSAAASANHGTSRADMQYMYQDSANATASTFANGEIYIPNYAGSNNKSVSVDSVTENNATSAFAALMAGLLSNTAAITSIKLGANNGTFVQYSTAYLYGVKNA